MAKIEGDIDNCDNDDDNNFDNDNDDDEIKKEHYYKINLNNNIKQIKSNQNQNQNNNDIFITTSLNDSLEQNIKPKNNNNIPNKIITKHSRNKQIQTKNNSSYHYPLIFNNIIIKNLERNKNSKENNKKLFQNNSYKNIEPYNNNNINGNINNNKIDLVFKEIIKMKRHSINLRKNNSFFKVKKKNKTKDYIFPTETNYINNSNTNFNKSIENLQFIKEKDNHKKIKMNSNIQNNTGVRTTFTSENQTKNPNTKNKITIITNKDVVEFKYGDSFTEENSNSEIKNINSINNNINININNNINNTSINVLNIKNNNNNLKINKDENDASIIESCNELKYWLDNIDLSIYYPNFIENNIYNINNLINQMKKPEEKLSYDDIETILKIHKPGHIYRLLVNLENYAGLIKENIARFLIKKNKNKNKDNFNKSHNRLKLSVSQDANNCVNCFRINILSSNNKNDLKSFLNRYNILTFYQNFYHNGFDLINFVMLQMFSTEPIDEIILENCFHIYEVEQREQVMKCINSEKNKILYFLNSNEYLNFELKDTIKYEDIIFEENKNNKSEKITIASNNVCTECIII